MPLLANCIVNTARPVLTSGASSAPQAYLSNISGHIMPHRSFFNPREMTPIRSGGGMETEYALKVDRDTDIRMGDIVTIFRNDGVTPWPGISSNEVWRVSYDYLTPPGFLEERVCIITRVTGGGPAY